MGVRAILPYCVGQVHTQISFGWATSEAETVQAFNSEHAVGDRGPTEAWVFCGCGSHLPAAVFSTLERAEEWIRAYKLSGMLTLYILNESAYDRAIRMSLFVPKQPHHFTADFIGALSGGDVHWHYDQGVRGMTPSGSDESA